MEKRINLSTPTTHGNEIEYIKEAFERNWIAPLGFNCDLFEEEVSEYLAKGDQRQYALSLSSGTAAIHLAMKLLGIGEGDKVIVSDMTFCASANPVSYEGGVQIFVDCERETWNMDPRALELALAKHPDAKAVILVHLYGTPSKMDELMEICDRFGVVLVEDAAEALSASYKGRCCGTFGKYNILSFNGNKIITTSGGGMLLTSSKQIRDKAFFYATQARECAPWYQHNEIGYNYRMSNVVAGIGRGQLLYLDEHRALKEKIYNRYKEAFRGLPVTMNPYLADTMPNFWLSCILVDEGTGVSPIDILNALEKENIEGRPIWKPMHMQPVFMDREFFYVENTPVDEDIFKRGLCLPSDIKMTEEEQDEVIRVIRGCFEK